MTGPLHTFLFGLSPTNALLNINGKKVDESFQTKPNEQHIYTYVSLSDVWTQLQTYYPSAGAYLKNGYGSFTIADGGNYLQIQTRSSDNSVEISIMKNGKTQSFSTTLKTIAGEPAIEKDKLIGYFEKVWCESYYLENIPDDVQKDLINVINVDIPNLESQDEQDGYLALRNFAVTDSTGPYNSSTNLYVDVMSNWRYEQNLGKEKVVVDIGTCFIPSAGIITGAVFDGDKVSGGNSCLSATAAEGVSQFMKNAGSDVLKEASCLVALTAIITDIIALNMNQYEDTGTYVGFTSFYGGKFYTSKYVLQPNNNIYNISSKHDMFSYPGGGDGKIKISYTDNDSNSYVQTISIRP